MSRLRYYCWLCEALPEGFYLDKKDMTAAYPDSSPTI